MDGYEVKDDGKLHTRYSDLVRCTEKSVLGVAREMLYGKKKFTSDITAFGKLRHDMFMEESLDSGRTPECFKEIGIDMKVSHIEQEMVAEIFPGVVLHSRLDAFAPEDGLIVDYKTATAEGSIKKYKSSKQHMTYALQLLVSGIVPKGAIYLGERWNAERTELLGYEFVKAEFDVSQVIEFKQTWLRDRAERLKVAVDFMKDNADQFTKNLV